MANANVPAKDRYRLVEEAFKTSTLLDGLVVVTINEVEAPRIVHWGGTLPRFIEDMHTWGEAGTVAIKEKFQGKVEDHGVQCMFVGYAIKHAPGTFRMWNPTTDGIMESRDII